MGFFGKLRGEFVDIVEWLDDSNDTMVYRFKRYDNQIKYGAQLIVREGQVAVFIDKGKLADVFSPGMYQLETGNIPILSTLQGWKHGFSSPFKAEVYFVSTRKFTNQKWGTKNPIMLKDAEFGPIRLRAFGNYVIRVKDPQIFIREVVGTDGHFTTDEITDQLRNIIITRFVDHLAESKIQALDIASNYNELGEKIGEIIAPDVALYGIELSQLLIENISMPPAVEEALDKRTTMNILGNLNEYTQFQTAEAIKDAASNPGGLGAAGVGVGAGFAMGGQMAQSFSQGQRQPPAVSATPAPPPVVAAVQYHVLLDGQQSGPHELDRVTSMIHRGTLNGDTLIWKAGMAQWAKASEVAELNQIISSSTPPPLPPPISG